ncbi:cytochrome b2 [Setomelanomma holmii]|uniref:Cytochrome b2 n=1 Tax=Setomelanomma holmii TaxID=210430 RepID=A0A9P4LNF1_9PLEO|nr:cytochrome b2 [Setomelanomma holmii]
MKYTLFSHLFATAILAARPFLNKPDTGIDDALAIPQNGSLPDLSRLLGLPDFHWAARHVGEWSYRNNLEAFHRLRFRPRVMVDVVDIEASLGILGFKFSAPFFISLSATAGMVHPKAERGLPSLASTLSMSDVAEARVTQDQILFNRIEQSGAKATVLTVDSAGDRTRHRALRYVPDTNIARTVRYTYMTWPYYQQLQNMTSLHIILKGIQTVEDARMAIKVGAPAIFLSNHGGRMLDGAPSTIEVALEILKHDPIIFQQTEVYADGGVRYDTDILKLLALGVRAVGLGRPFMFANVFGAEGVARAIQLLKREVATSAAALEVRNFKRIDHTNVESTPNG